MIGVVSGASAQDAVDDLFANPRPAPSAPRTDVQPDVETPILDPEIVETRRLNAAIDARNRAVRDANAAAATEHELRLREREEWVERLNREHDAELAAYEAEQVRRQRAHEAEVAEWRRRFEACRRGVAAACAPRGN